MFLHSSKKLTSWKYILHSSEKVISSKLLIFVWKFIPLKIKNPFIFTRNRKTFFYSCLSRYQPVFKSGKYCEVLFQILKYFKIFFSILSQHLFFMFGKLLNPSRTYCHFFSLYTSENVWYV